MSETKWIKNTGATLFRNFGGREYVFPGKQTVEVPADAADSFQQRYAPHLVIVAEPSLQNPPDGPLTDVDGNPVAGIASESTPASPEAPTDAGQASENTPPSAEPPQEQGEETSE